MTRSPFSVTLIALVPLAALGWPLAKVINQKAYTQAVVEDAPAGPLVTADLFVNSAHPFEAIVVTIGEASWTFAPDDDVKVIHYPRASQLILKVTVVWPGDTPESAVLLKLQPEGEIELSHTLWGLHKVTAEIEFPQPPDA